MFYVYIIYSASGDVYYKGYTENIDKRLAEHNDAKSRYTSHFSDWKVVYQKGFQTKREALIEEKRIKRLNRESLLRLVFL